jgi:hypothetical protein
MKTFQCQALNESSWKPRPSNTIAKGTSQSAMTSGWLHFEFNEIWGQVQKQSLAEGSYHPPVSDPIKLMKKIGQIE